MGREIPNGEWDGSKDGSAGPHQGIAARFTALPSKDQKEEFEEIVVAYWAIFLATGAAIVRAPFWGILLVRCLVLMKSAGAADVRAPCAADAAAAPWAIVRALCYLSPVISCVLAV